MQVVVLLYEGCRAVEVALSLWKSPSALETTVFTALSTRLTPPKGGSLQLYKGTTAESPMSPRKSLTPYD